MKNVSFNEKYRILQQIGRGAFAIVYKARRISDGMIVAVKEIIRDSEKALTEIENMQKLQHENIV